MFLVNECPPFFLFPLPRATVDCFFFTPSTHKVDDDGDVFVNRHFCFFLPTIKISLLKFPEKMQESLPVPLTNRDVNRQIPESLIPQKSQQPAADNFKVPNTKVARPSPAANQRRPAVKRKPTETKKTSEIDTFLSDLVNFQVKSNPKNMPRQLC